MALRRLGVVPKVQVSVLDRAGRGATAVRRERGVQRRLRLPPLPPVAAPPAGGLEEVPRRGLRPGPPVPEPARREEPPAAATPTAGPEGGRPSPAGPRRRGGGPATRALAGRADRRPTSPGAPQPMVPGRPPHRHLQERRVLHAPLDHELRRLLRGLEAQARVLEARRPVLLELPQRVAEPRQSVAVNAGAHVVEEEGAEVGSGQKTGFQRRGPPAPAPLARGRGGGEV